MNFFFFFFSSRRRHTRLQGDWSSDVCSSDLPASHRWRLRRPGAPTGGRTEPNRARPCWTFRWEGWRSWAPMVTPRPFAGETPARAWAAGAAAIIRALVFDRRGAHREVQVAARRLAEEGRPGPYGDRIRCPAAGR